MFYKAVFSKYAMTMGSRNPCGNVSRNRSPSICTHFTYSDFICSNVKLDKSQRFCKLDKNCIIHIINVLQYLSTRVLCCTIQIKIDFVFVKKLSKYMLIVMINTIKVTKYKTLADGPIFITIYKTLTTSY